MQNENTDKTEYVAYFSGGKDSAATVALAHEKNEPLDEIIFIEVMYSKTISGELPEHIDFVKNTAFPIFEKCGYRTKIIKSDKNYLDCFHHIVTKSNHADRIGKKAGFPMSGMCMINRECKLRAIRNYKISKIGYKTIQYIGIAEDEPERLRRLNAGKISLLKKYGYDEKRAKEKAEQYGLLSPCYNYSNRGGCWFCPNSRLKELRHLRNFHPDLWQELLKLESTPDIVGDVWDTRNRISIHEMEDLLYWESRQMTVYEL